MKNKLHIGFFTNTYRPTMSGVVRSIDTFRQAFTSMGHNVFIFAQKASDFEDSEPFIFRYPAIELPFANDYAVPVPYSLAIDEILPSLKLDVIHSHHPFLLGETAARKAKSLNLPLVFTFHTRYEEYASFIPISVDFTRMVVDRWMSHYLEKCQHVVTPSESIKQILQENGVEGDITVVPTGIDLTPFRQADRHAVREERGWGDDLVMISVGRLAKEKNFETLLRAAALVLPSRTNTRLVIVGGGMEEKALIKLSRELGIHDKVEFTGSIPYEEVPRHLKGADIFCFASTTETQGLVTLEAMAAGLPVVAVNATGTRDSVQDGQEGLLTENSSEALAEAIMQVIDNPEMRQKFTSRASKKVEWFDIKRQAERMLGVYEQATEAKKAGRYIRTAGSEEVSLVEEPI